MTIENEIQSIKNQLVELLSPKSIILFGSQSKGTARKNSDIDFCIIKNTDDKKALLTNAYIHIESTKPFDLILYTEDEWNAAQDELSSFAHLIKKGGLVLYGGQ
jgi:predicted nucleotidyltransferase